ncbi:Hypothetical predicted protein [Paramuricea clavata]|uniref:Uncharacterized protein n=1 Tax=Paramuricea clavata TaxID=317549 RepID=A0A6S7GD70_PARCT|nr:Hypothetical predicted protein [Paramuricea clavata]
MRAVPADVKEKIKKLEGKILPRQGCSPSFRRITAKQKKRNLIISKNSTLPPELTTAELHEKENPGKSFQRD